MENKIIHWIAGTVLIVADLAITYAFFVLAAFSGKINNELNFLTLLSFVLLVFGTILFFKRKRIGDLLLLAPVVIFAGLFFALFLSEQSSKLIY